MLAIQANFGYNNLIMLVGGALLGLVLFSKVSTFTHENGHYIGLYITKYTLLRGKGVEVDASIQLTRVVFTLFTGVTHSPIYKYLEENKSSEHAAIRLNAISGFMFNVLFNLLIMLVVSNSIVCGFCIGFILFEVITFFSSSDWRIFRKPETFKAA